MAKSLLLTHPQKFSPRQLPVKDVKDPDQKASHRLDNRIQQAQKDLVRGVADKTVSEAEFCRTVSDLERLSALRAQYRSDGLSTQERTTLNATFEARGAEKPFKMSPELRGYYHQLQAGKLQAEELVDELNWRTEKAYGAVLSARPGTVYSEERPKLRAYLHLPRESQKDSAGSTYIHPELDTLIGKAIGLFETLDSNADQIVDRKEARSLLTEYQALGLTPAEATTLYSRQKQMAAAIDPKNSAEELKREDLLALLSQNHQENLSEELEENLTKISTRYRSELSRDTPEPTDFKLGYSFQPNRVRQGKEGSCWFLCNLPALDSEQLSQVIKPEGEAFRVTLADGRTTLVNELNEAERRVYSHGDGAWSGLLEKGVSQILGVEGKDINGGFPRVARKMLVNKTSTYFPFHTVSEDKPDLRDRDVLFQTMSKALEHGSAIFAGASASDFEKEISEISAANHAYTVLSVDRENDAVTVRNPWGGGERADLDGTNDGVFQLSQDQFFANFTHLYMDKDAVA